MIDNNKNKNKMTTKLTSLINLTMISKTNSKTFYKLTFAGKEFMRIHITKEDKLRKEFTTDENGYKMIAKSPELAMVIINALYK